MSSEKGFTLIELIITLAVLAIFASIAAPSFQMVIDNNRVTSQSNTMLAALQYARSEAVSRSVPVTLTIDAGAGSWCVHLAANCTDAGNQLRTGQVSAAVAVSNTLSYTFDARGQRQTPNFTAGGALATTGIEPLGCTAGANRRRSIGVGIGGRAAVTQEACE